MDTIVIVHGNQTKDGKTDIVWIYEIIIYADGIIVHVLEIHRNKVNKDQKLTL